MAKPYEIRTYEHTYDDEGNLDETRIIHSIYARDIPGNTLQYHASMARLIQKGFDQGTRWHNRRYETVICCEDGSTHHTY